MPSGSGASNKAKIARRVVEVLEYFDDSHREATVMDIVRRYGRPQSSTSELLSSLVELGLLNKDPLSRSYQLTPRAALLGTAGQPAMIREGHVVRLVDRLAAQTGLSVALFGMVGMKAQIVTWRNGSRASASSMRGLYGGLQEPLANSSAGRLLLSTIPQPRCDGVVRRLNAEAPDEHKFSAAEMSAQLQACRNSGNVRGPVGFGSSAQAIAAILPCEMTEHPLAVGLIYGAEDRVNPDTLLDCINEAIRQILSKDDAAPAAIKPFLSAA